MNKVHYSLDEISPIWLILLGIFSWFRAHGFFRTHADVDVSLGYGDYGESPDFPRRLLYTGLS